MDSKLKFSDYLTLLPHKDEYLIAQGILGKFLLMKKKLFNEVRQNLNVKGSPEIEKAKNELLGILAIVPEEHNEQDLIKEIFNSALEKAQEMDWLYLSLTLRCNFSCVYCFEAEKKVDITKEIIDKSLNPLFKFARKNKPESIFISFFGGEPLLCPDKLEYAVLKVRAFCKKNKVKPVFSITTNGSIFNQRIVELFTAVRDLGRVQISLDGPREVHDQRRMFKSGRGSYDVIMENVPRWMKIAQWVLIRINVDRENLSHVPELLKALSRWKEGNLLIWPNKVTEGFGRGAERIEALGMCRFKDLKHEFYSLAEKLGLQVFREEEIPKCQSICCGASIARPGWIGPDGEMYCCALDLGFKSKSVGNVFSGYDERKARRWRKYSVLHIKKCLKCKHVFFCGGPCPAQVRKGRTERDLCGNGFKKLLQQNFDEIKRTTISIG